MISPITIALTSNASGDVTVILPVPRFTKLHAVVWSKGTCDDGVDVIISSRSDAAGVSQAILTVTDANTSAWYYPRIAAVGITGSALTWYEPPVVAGELVVTLAQAGNAKTGTVTVYVER